jgi:hypothetical protein
MKIDPLRPLTSAESLVLGLLLGAEFAGAETLRIQARSALVCRRCDCGCPTVDLQVAADAPEASNLKSRLVPSEGEVSPVGQEAPGQIILFVDGGRLSSLEYVYFDVVPKEWPSADRIQVFVTSREG